MKKLKLVALTAIAALLLPITPVGAQMLVDNPPDTKGPVALGEAKCSAEKVHQPKEPDLFIARVKLCSWLIKFDPKAESDKINDYGVAWAQSTVKPINGWCARRVSTKVRMPYGKGKVYNQTPDAPIVGLNKPFRITEKLRIGANGRSSQGATVKKSFRLYPDSYSGSKVKNDRGRVYKTDWFGAERSKLAFVTGLSISWDATDGAPTFVPNVGYRFIDPVTCSERRNP